jgi:hypothetical protein
VLDRPGGCVVRAGRRGAVHRWPRPPGAKNRKSATRHDVGRILATGEAYHRPTHHNKRHQTPA